jgi:hypothetical protein
MTTDQAHALAGDLLRELTPHAGDPEAVDQVMRRWLATEDVRRLSLVSIAAVRLIFADCLTRTPSADVPPGALTYTNPEENHE